ncbi:hypothetical protein LZD49_12445 [Dyadobacter sp. CY261]|uniref:DUF6712 family protein n=1 Tax=Dyadobacter sp. CY261 TaxID=2907203 RepID=UPI001F47D6EC|nr:DUF6712 family protein [Dyadobacter sp. CY261]MCF0071282.1 hypothetical protein [Dyadobacter sp. CY261]
MLISNIDELREYIPVGRDLDFVSVKPSIRKAERRFILPLLGKDFYRLLVSEYEGNLLSEDHQELVEYIRSASANLTMWYYVQIGDVLIDSSGMYKQRTEQRWVLSESDQKRLQNSFLSDGLDALDDLMNHLEDNISKYSTYSNSKEYLAERRGLVTSAATVQTVFTLFHPRVTFQAMREAIRYHEDGRVAPIMQDYYGILIDKKQDDLNEVDTVALRLARRALIYLASARSMITRTVKFTNEGLKVMAGDDQVSQFENDRIEASAKEFEQSGQIELDALVKHLNKYEPDGYTKPEQVTYTDHGAQSGGIVFF